MRAATSRGSRRGRLPDAGGGGWRLSGQKTWTTRGAFCTHMFGLFRSDPDAERHRGLTYFLVPLDAPGVTVRGFGRLDGDEGFAEVFLDDVFVPESDVLGTVNEGWRVAMATTSAERGLTLRSPGRFMATAARLVDLWRERGDASDGATRDEVVRAWIDARGLSLADLPHGDAHDRWRRARRGIQPHEGVLVRARRAPALHRPGVARR